MEALSSSSVRQGSQRMEQRQFSRKLKWKSRGDLKLNSDIQERALRFEARSSYYVVMPPGIYHLNRRKTKFRMMVSTMLIMMHVTMGKKN